MEKTGTGLEAIAEISAAVESGAGLPAAVRAAARALEASVAVLDQSGGVLAAAAGSPADEKALLTDRRAQVIELRIADKPVGTLRLRNRKEASPEEGAERGGAAPPDEPFLRMISTLIALEVERTTGPEHAGREAATKFLSDVLERRLTDRRDLVARGDEFGLKLGEGGSVIAARARPLNPEAGDWRARVLSVAERGVRGVVPGSLVAALGDEIYVLVAGDDERTHHRTAAALVRELSSGISGFDAVVGLSRHAPDPVDLHRAGKEALLAANVAEASRETFLAFEETGAYRLLLPALTDDPSELERFYTETIAPLVAYDDQYQTDLVTTLDTYLENDGHSEGTARALHTHRHTVRYRLERIRELSGLDVGSSEGREKLSLGLKAMRVMGIPTPGGPAFEPGAEAGHVPRKDKDL